MKGLPPEFSPQALDLGRTHDVIGCTPVTVIVCRCQARQPVVLNGCPAQASCNACGRVFIIGAVTCDGHMVGTKIDTREANLLLETVQ